MVLPSFSEIIEPERICENCKWYDGFECVSTKLKACFSVGNEIFLPASYFSCRFWENKDKWIINKK